MVSATEDQVTSTNKNSPIFEEKQKMKSKVFRVTAWLMAGFVLLFAFRLLYGYTDPYMKGYEQNEYISDFFEDLESIKRNYASDDYKKGGFEKSSEPQTDGVQEPSGGGASQQMFEKIARLKNKSSEFEQDEKIIRSSVKKHNGLIQYEHNEGNPGDRELHLSIGVPPENFDAMITELKKIGRLKSIQVTKYDKTNEYRNLNAHKASLEKTRNTLTELKSKEGKIDEYITLSNRILEIEEQLQELGVSLGDFDKENEFCTIQITVSEGKFILTSFMHRLKVALEWTFNYYCIFLLICLFALGTSWFGIKIYEKVRPMLKK